MQFLGQKHSDKLEHTWVMYGTLVPTHDTSWSHGCSVSSRPPTVTASFSYGSDDAFRFWDSICLNTGHGAFSNEVSIQSLCVSQPQAPHGGSMLTGWCPMPSYTLCVSQSFAFPF